MTLFSLSLSPVSYSAHYVTCSIEYGQYDSDLRKMSYLVGSYESQNNSWRDVIGRCITECRNLKFVYAGVEREKECWCAHRYVYDVYQKKATPDPTYCEAGCKKQQDVLGCGGMINRAVVASTVYATGLRLSL